MAYSSDSDEIVPVVISLKIHKSFFKPTYAKGYILFNGKEYQDMCAIGYDIYKNNSFWKNIDLKIQGFRYDFFISSDLKLKQIEWLTDTILVNISNDYKNFSLFKVDHETDGGRLYYINN